MRFHSRPALLSSALVAVVLAMSACTTETHHGPTEIRMPDVSERYVKEAVHKAYHDGRHFGSVWTLRVKDGDSNDFNDRRQRFVKDLEGRTVGFVTEENKAYRYRAHAEPEFVSNSPELELCILAIFGWTEGEVTLERHTVPLD